MSSDPDPNRPFLCMACRSAPARYYGTWALEGLCRTCILRMAPDIQVKVLRDMHPADRKRWQVDDLFKRGARAAPRPGLVPAGGLERKVARLLCATEVGSASALEKAAEGAGARVVKDEEPPE